MPLTVFDIKGIPGHRRERIEAAVVAGGKHASGPHEVWITADPFRGGFTVLITGPYGFERTVAFALDDDPAVIAERVRENAGGVGPLDSGVERHLTSTMPGEDSVNRSVQYRI
jgi:hypothetical protein